MVLELSPDVEESLLSKARAENVPLERYTAELLEWALSVKQKAAVQELNRYLDEMAHEAPIDIPPDELDAAIDEALLAVRPKRLWHTK